MLIIIVVLPIGWSLPYRTQIYWAEVMLYIVIIAVQCCAFVLSKTDQAIITPLLLIPTIIGLTYFIIWQQFVLRIDIIINSIFIMFQILYILTSFVK